MKQINEILQELENLNCSYLTKGAGSDDYHVPELYFEQLPKHLLAINKIANDQSEVTLNIEPLSTPYALPEGYFSSFDHQLLQKVKVFEQVVNSYTAQSEPQAETFKVPSNYFSQFEEQLFQAVGIREIPDEKLSDALTSLKTATAFSVPDQYFEQEINIEKKAKKPEEKSNVIPFEQPKTGNVVHVARRSIKWAGWAAAAAVFVILAIGGMQFLNTENTTTNTDFNNRIAKISDDRIKDWLGNHLDELDLNTLGISTVKAELEAEQALDNFSSKDIKAYLESEAL